MAKNKPQAPYLSEPAPDYNWAAGDAFLASLAEPAPAESSGMVRRALGDTGIALAKGVIGVPEAMVGMADIVSGGRAGKLAEDAGFRPKDAKAFLDEYLSPEQQEANRRVQAADGWVDTLVEAVSNPSTIWQSAVESAPSMLGGAGVARAALKVAPRLGVAAAGIGEGAVSAGQTAEQVRQESADGLLTGTQSAIAAGSGALTGVLGAIAGKVAQRMGIADVDTFYAGLPHASPTVQKGIVRKILEGVLTEGVLEELPQSLQEQVAQNLALGKPLDEGVANAAVMGMLAGGLMGGVHAPLGGHAAPLPVDHMKPKAGDVVRDQKVPEVGPLTRAANAGLDAQAAAVDALPPGPPPLMPAQETALLDHANKRAAELDAKQKGDEKTKPQFLTPAEKAEREFLNEHGGDVTKLRDTYPDVAAPKVETDAEAARAARERRRDGIDAGLVAQPTDILNPKTNAPWKSQIQARQAAKERPDTKVAMVEGGYVLRPLTAKDAARETINALPKEGTNVGVGIPAERAPAGGGGAGPADAGRGVDGDGRVPAEPAGAVPAGDGAAAAPAADAGLADRVHDTAVAPIAGKPIDAEWTAFAPESGTKGMPRADMPQVKAEHRGALTQFMLGRGITHEQAEVPAASLKPTQQEFSPGKVDKAREFAGEDRAILVSSDGHVLDGHHQWLAKREAGAPIRVIRFDAPIDKLVDEAKQFPSAEQSDGATTAAPVPAPAAPAPAGEQGDDLQSQADKIVLDSGRASISLVQRHLRIGYNRAAKLLESMEQRGLVGPMKTDGSREILAQAHKGEPAAPAPAAAAQPPSVSPSTAATAAPSPQTDEHGAWWTRATTNDRLAVLAKAGWVGATGARVSLSAERVSRMPWDKLKESQRDRIAAARAIMLGAAPAPAPSTEAPAGAATGSSAAEPTQAASAPEATPKPPIGEAPKPDVSPNKVFTEDAAAKARAVLKAKLGQVSSGIDPELLQAGITLAGYHIEKGARTFAAYAKAMVEDLGAAIKPYLKSFYMAVRYDPRASGFDGMSTPAEVDAADVDAITSEKGPSVEPQAPSADTSAKEPENAARPLDRPSPSALEGAPAADVPAPGGDGQARSDAQGSGRSDGAGDGGAASAGVQRDGGVGDDAGAVPLPAGGTRPGRTDGEKPRVRGSRGREPDAGHSDDAGRAGDLSPGPNAAPVPAPAFKPTDFAIADDFALGEGGQKTKYRANVDAIRLLKQLDTEQRPATPDEQKTLARYVGWGGIPQAFDAKNGDWSKEHAELKDLLTPDEYADARQSTQYAHYTSREVIGGVYDALARMGFTGGKILEPGSGVGNFMGLMPASHKSSSRFTAIEREPIAAGIARHLYPQQNVQLADYTEFRGNDEYFDAAIGNPPFASTTLTDASGRKHLSGLSVHNYFFAKSIDQLREGGVLAMVVSNFFLDAKTDTARKYIAERTRLLGAIRLPNNAFSKNANTEVTTDIVFLQKRPESEWGGKEAREDAKRWLDTAEVKDARGGAAIAVNRYFAANPNMMLGSLGRYGTMYGPNQPALVARPGQDTGALLREAVARLPENVYTPPAVAGTKALTEATVVALKDPSVQEGGFYVDDGKLFQRLPDAAGEGRARELTPQTQWTEKTALGELGFARLRDLAGIRSTLRGLLAAELNGDKAMEDLRAKLNEQYDAYTKANGLLNDPTTTRLFDDDPDFPLLASLEHEYAPGIGQAAAKRQGIKPQKSTAKKAPIFRQRVVDQRQQVRKVETPADALAVSMAERGRIDSAYIGKLLGKDAQEVLQELASGDKPLLFLDPATDEYVLRDAYLSGNVRAKLAQAKRAGAFANARALEAVVPEDVSASQISARVGSPWVPERVYEDFARELFGQKSRVSISYVKINSSYAVGVKAENDTANTSTWGTSSYPGADLLAALLNNRDIKVMTPPDSEGRRSVNVEATEQANIKAQDIRNRFADWLFADGARSEVLVRAYNDTNNNYVTRQYDGSFMTFPGKVPDDIIKFRRHQRNAIARIVQDRTALLDHVVGAGKTFTIVAGAMELKRTGLANKPMIAVPNHLVKQWASDFYRLYPGANILTATKKDFAKANRRKFLAKIATGDWDAVVIAHSSYGFIKPAPDFEARFNERQVKNIVDTIEAVEAMEGDDRAKKRTVKQLEALKERLEQRIKSLRDKPMDALLDFEQIGVDQLFVDEAHLFKNLMFSTKMQNIRGLGDSKGSQRAYDMYVKVAQIYEKNGRGQGVVFATGTPVSNTLAEMYHMMRYLMPQAMEDMGFTSFDAWANTFASVNQEWDQKTSGDGFKAINTMSSFVNTHELLRIFDQVADTVTMEDIKTAFREENGREFPLPALKTGRRQPVSLVKSEAQNAYMGEIAARAKALEQRRGPPQKGEDNALVLMTDARKAAMDVRLVDPNVTEREKGGRIDTAADRIAERYKQWHDVKGTQLVFSDLGTPIKTVKAELAEYQELKARVDAGASEDVASAAMLGDEAAIAKVEDAEEAQAAIDAKGADWLTAIQAALRGFSVYDDLKAALIERGIPEAEIAFIHDFNTDEQKAALFRKVNSGQIRVLLGSTAKMGAGTNVQERLVALHHLDVPWKPSDIEQREGRIIRQGNKLAGPGAETVPGFEAEILAYVTQDTLDMKMWMIQERKLKMINQLRARQIDREIENSFEDMEMSAGEMQAAATGNMDLLREIQLRTDVKKLEQRQRAFNAQRNDLESRKRRAEQQVASIPTKVEELAPWVAAGKAYRESKQEDRPVSVTVNGKTYTNRDDAAEVLRGIVDEHDKRLAERDEKIGADPNLKPADVPMPKLAVEFNGKTYGSKAAVAEAFVDAVGDADRFDWSFDGAPYIRRSALSKALAQPVADAIATDTEQPIGGFGPFKVSVEGQTDRLGNKVLDVIVDLNGKQQSSDLSVAKEVDGKSAEKTAAAAVGLAERIVVRAENESDYLRHDLERAKKQLDEVSKADMPAEWPDAGKLETARAEHRDILKRLSAKPGQEADAAVKPEDGETAFSRTKKPTAKERAEAVQELADLIASRWANPPEVIVVESLDDPKVPNEVRSDDEASKAQGAEGQPAGFFYKGKVYLVASQLTGDANVVTVLFHEALGHYGLRGTFGSGLGTILDRLAVLNQGKVRAKAREYALDYEKTSDRRMAAEEVLAEMAQTHPELGWVQRAVAAIRTWLREHVPGFKSMAFSDAEIIRSFLIPAREFVRSGRGKPETHPTTFSRTAFSLTSTMDTLKSATTARGAANLAHDLLHSDRTFNWWHRTIGTQYQKAQDDPQHFKPVYDAAQDYLHDINTFANDPAAAAPDVVPQLKSWRDIMPKVLGGHGRPLRLSEADAKSLADAVFKGTLDDKRVYTPDELRSEFGMNDKQVERYQQFRAAVDRSLDLLVASDVARYLGQDLPQAMKQMVSDGDTGRFRGLVAAFAQQRKAQADEALDAARKARRDRLAEMFKEHKAQRAAVKPGSGLSIEQRLEDEQRSITAEQDARVAAAEAEAKRWSDFERVTRQKWERIDQLKDEGYAPLTRFGRYTVYVQGPAGEQQFFGLYESQTEANRAARQFRESAEFDGSSVTTGVLSEEAYKQFSGMSPETVELFAEVAGVEKTPLFDEYLRRAKNNRSALKRLIGRKGIAGYSEDPQRVLAAFLTSNARAASSNLHLGEIGRLVEAIPKEKGDVKDEAIRLQQYVQNPGEEAQAIRGLLFVQYLGGSVASALVNMTQPFMMTFPYLSQYGGAAKTATRLVAAMGTSLAPIDEKSELGRALAKAEKEGVVSPQELHQLQAETSRTLGSHPGVRKLVHVWGSLFALAEQFNRRVSFIAAYRTATEQGIADPYEFASKAVDETQGVYNRCVDEETEMLTAAGWKRVDQLAAGEAVFGIDDSGRVTSDVLVDLHRYPGPQRVIRLESSTGFAVIATPNHEHLVQCYSSRDKKWQALRRVRGDALKQSQHLLRAPLGDSLRREQVYTDDQVRLLAWVATEGHFFAHRNVTAKRGVAIVQSATHNPGYVEEITALLDRLGGHYNRKETGAQRADTMVCWQLRKPLWSFIHEALPEKRVTMALASRLTDQQMRLFLETFTKGDGHFPKEGGSTITQRNVETLNTLQAMAVLTGQTSTLYERVGEHDFGSLYTAKNSIRAHRKALIGTDSEVNGVWCPQTTSGAWIARRNGRTFVTGNSNRPNWARGAVGSTLFTFKQYSISYLEFLKRLPPQQRALALVVLVLAAGAQGLPFADDLDDLIDTIGQALGYDTNAKAWKTKVLTDALGAGAADFVQHGFSAISGFPLDVSARLGLSNVIPGTGVLLKSKTDKAGEVFETLGPAGSTAKDLLQGEFRPLAIRNLGKAITMYQTGQYRDSKDRKVMDVIGMESVIKGIGFQPASVARESRSISMKQQQVALARNVESDISAQWAQGIVDGEPEKVQAARDRLKQWNEDNPASRIVIKPEQIQKRVRDMRKTRAERFEKTVPREMRGSV
jgi:N12 class adenine-specific DNA methylase